MYQMNSTRYATRGILLFLGAKDGSVGMLSCNWSAHYVSIWRDAKRYMWLIVWLKIMS